MDTTGQEISRKVNENAVYCYTYVMFSNHCTIHSFKRWSIAADEVDQGLKAC